MAKTEYKVGETFQFGLKTLKCVEGEWKLLCKLFLATICRIWMRFSY